MLPQVNRPMLRQVMCDTEEVDAAKGLLRFVGTLKQRGVLTMSFSIRLKSSELSSTDSTGCERARCCLSMSPIFLLFPGDASKLHLRASRRKLLACKCACV